MTGTFRIHCTLEAPAKLWRVLHHQPSNCAKAHSLLVMAQASTSVHMASACQPSFSPSPDQLETTAVQSVIGKLELIKHPEGGYFAETDRDTRRVPNPFIVNEGSSDSTRAASTTIYYFLTPVAPQGMFHRNKARTMHTLHWGRGRYVVIHADERGDDGAKARVESFVVGKDIEAGERMQWMVDGGKFKASFLLPDAQDCNGKNVSGGLLISETVVPGFEFEDHDFLTPESLKDLADPAQSKSLSWLVRSN